VLSLFTRLPWAPIAPGWWRDYSQDCPSLTCLPLGDSAAGFTPCMRVDHGPVYQQPWCMDRVSVCSSVLGGHQSSLGRRGGSGVSSVFPRPEGPAGVCLMDDFEAAEIPTGEARIFVRWSGTGAPVLLLHGFPQTHLMWRRTAASPPLYGRLRRPAWVRAQSLPGLHPGPCALCQARHGARHGRHDGAAGVSALRGRGA
jgi:hypothetical protein